MCCQFVNVCSQLNKMFVESTHIRRTGTSPNNHGYCTFTPLYDNEDHGSWSLTQCFMMCNHVKSRKEPIKKNRLNPCVQGLWTCHPIGIIYRLQSVSPRLGDLKRAKPRCGRIGTAGGWTACQVHGGLEDDKKRRSKTTIGQMQRLV